MTHLSDSLLAIQPGPAPFRMARRSHYLRSMTSLATTVVALSATGCLVSDPPEYQDAERTAPMLQRSLAVPAPTEILPVSLGDSVTFTVPFRSEDGGVAPVALLMLDYTIRGQESLLGLLQQSASDFQDTSRSFSITATFSADSRNRVNPGCHQISMVATHLDNLDTDLLPVGLEDTDVITWWAEITDPNNPESSTLDSCPSNTDLDTEGT